jgi:hypothetical protein
MKAVKAAGASGMFLPSSNSFLLFRVQTQHLHFWCIWEFKSKLTQEYDHDDHGGSMSETFFQYLQFCWMCACNLCHFMDWNVHGVSIWWTGLVVPDLPLEETDKLCEFTFANDLELVSLLCLLILSLHLHHNWFLSSEVRCIALFLTCPFSKQTGRDEQYVKRSFKWVIMSTKALIDHACLGEC